MIQPEKNCYRTVRAIPRDRKRTRYTFILCYLPIHLFSIPHRAARTQSVVAIYASLFFFDIIILYKVRAKSLLKLILSVYIKKFKNSKY